MKELEDKVRTYLEERGWDHLRPSDLAKSIMIEGAELLELFQWDNPELEEVLKDEERMKAIKSELADILIYALDLSVSLKLDTKAIVLEKLKKVEEKYPAELMKKNAKKGAGSGEDAEYWRIKKEVRRQEV